MQLPLFGRRPAPRRDGRGGARVRSGPKPSGRVGHGARPRHPRYQPVHVTLRVRKGIPGLRRWHLYHVLREAFRKANWRDDWRLVHFSVQSNHLHLICEADDRRALTRGTQGLAIRTAKALNKRLERKGKVFADRFHAVELSCPLQVKRTLVYVFANALGHGGGFHAAVDPFSSAAHFGGWKYPLPPNGERGPAVGKGPSTWLLSTGWLRYGKLRFHDRPS